MFWLHCRVALEAQLISVAHQGRSLCADHPGQLQRPLQHLPPSQHGGFPGGFPGGHLPQYQHSVLQPPQHPQPLAQPSADPVIDPTRAARAASGPIGASLESRGSSSSNLAAQVSAQTAGHMQWQYTLLVGPSEILHVCYLLISYRLQSVRKHCAQDADY